MEIYDPARLCFEGGDCFKKFMFNGRFEMVFPINDCDALDRAEIVMGALLQANYVHTPQRKENGDYHLVFIRRQA